jgi:hypothetical protein
MSRKLLLDSQPFESAKRSVILCSERKIIYSEGYKRRESYIDIVQNTTTGTERGGKLDSEKVANANEDGVSEI